MTMYTKIGLGNAGAVRNLDSTANSWQFGSIFIGSASPTELTKTILDKLVALQNGTDFSNGTNSHTHDGRYFTESELGSATSSSGSDLIGDDNTYSNFTPAAATIKGALSGIDTALASAGGSDFSDSLFRVSDNGTPSKKMAFEVSAIAASTVRTVTMPDANVDLGKIASALQKDGSVNPTANLPMASFKLTGLAAGSSAGDSVRYEQSILVSGANAFAADQSMGGFKLTNLADPVSGQDGVTLSYMNARLAGIKPKASVRVATTAAGTLATSFENGDTIDGVTIATGNRILIKDQAASENNGIYTVNASGAPTRATDFDSLSPIDEINGSWVSVQEGTANAGKIFVQFGTVVTLGSDPITFEYFNPIAGLIGGDMITFGSSTFSVDLHTTSGLESSNPGNVAGQLRVKLEASNPSLKITGSNELAAKLDTAGAITSGASGLIVGVDNSTVEISSNALRVKDAGITAAKLASGVADQSTITGGAGSALAVANSPLVKRPMVAGEAFAANTSFLVRLAINGETAGRVYKADKDASSTINYNVIGIAHSAAGVSAGANIDVVMLGEYNLGSSDAAFASADLSKEVYLLASGAFSITPPSSVNEAVVVAGFVQTTAKMWIQPQGLRYIN